MNPGVGLYPTSGFTVYDKDLIALEKDKTNFTVAPEYQHYWEQGYSKMLFYSQDTSGNPRPKPGWKHKEGTMVPILNTLRIIYCRHFHNTTVMGTKFDRNTSESRKYNKKTGETTGIDCNDNFLKFALRNYGCNCFSDNFDGQDTWENEGYLGWRSRQLSVKPWHLADNGDPVDWLDKICQDTHRKFHCVLQDRAAGIYQKHSPLERIPPGRKRGMTYHQRKTWCETKDTRTFVPKNHSEFYIPTQEDYDFAIKADYLHKSGWQNECARKVKNECGLNLDYPFFVDQETGEFHCGFEDNPDYQFGVLPGEECARDVCFIAKQFSEEVIQGLVDRGYGEKILEDSTEKTGLWAFMENPENRKNYLVYTNHPNVTDNDGYSKLRFDASPTQNYSAWLIEWDMSTDTSGNIPRYFPDHAPWPPKKLPLHAFDTHLPYLSHWSNDYSTASHKCRHREPVEYGQCHGEQPFRYPEIISQNPKLNENSFDKLFNEGFVNPENWPELPKLTDLDLSNYYDLPDYDLSEIDELNLEANIEGLKKELKILDFQSSARKKPIQMSINLDGTIDLSQLYPNKNAKDDLAKKSTEKLDQVLMQRSLGLPFLAEDKNKLTWNAIKDRQSQTKGTGSLTSSEKELWYEMVNKAGIFRLSKKDLINMLKYSNDQENDYSEYFQLKFDIDPQDENFIIGKLDNNFISQLKNHAQNPSIFKAINHGTQLVQNKRGHLSRATYDEGRIPLPSKFSSLSERIILSVGQGNKENKNKLERGPPICSFSRSEITCESQEYYLWRQNDKIFRSSLSIPNHHKKKKKIFQRSSISLQTQIFDQFDQQEKAHKPKKLTARPPPKLMTYMKADEFRKILQDLYGEKRIFDASMVEILNLNGIEIDFGDHKNENSNQDNDIHPFLCDFPNLKQLHLQSTSLSSKTTLNTGSRKYKTCLKNLNFLDLSRNFIDDIEKIFGTKRVLERYFAPKRNLDTNLVEVQLQHFDLSHNKNLKGQLKFRLKRPNKPLVRNIAGEFDLDGLKRTGQTTYNEFYQEISKLALGDRFEQDR